MAATNITVVRGNIVARSDCDGIINSANEYLIAGSGVCGAIYKAAGPELEPHTKKLAPLALGCGVASPGFNLSARWIIHARGPKFHQDPNPPIYLANALESAVVLADQLRVQRRAVPAISTGMYGYPVREAASILIEARVALRDWVCDLREIRFSLLDDATYQTFKELVTET